MNNPRLRWLMILGVGGALLATLPLLFTFEILAVDFPVLMEDSAAIEYHDGPHLIPPKEAVPISRPILLDAGIPENPVPSDAVSIRRGTVLYSLHCSVCHGETGEGDGPVTAYWRADARRPSDLTEDRVTNYEDGGIRQIITNGIGSMPPMRENLSERERWDVVNYLRTLQMAKKSR